MADALANESILDMQGITEALSRYYYSHNNSFDGLFAAPEYQQAFERVANDAIHYEKFRFTGDVSKPSFDEVYETVRGYIREVLPRQKERDLER